MSSLYDFKIATSSPWPTIELSFLDSSVVSTLSSQLYVGAFERRADQSDKLLRNLLEYADCYNSMRPDRIATQDQLLVARLRRWDCGDDVRTSFILSSDDARVVECLEDAASLLAKLAPHEITFPEYVPLRDGLPAFKTRERSAPCGETTIVVIGM